jgi:tryptophan-rich sensory protein
VTHPVIFAVVYTILVAGMGGFLTKLGPWYYALRYPSWKPPDWLFGPAWTVILGLACTSSIIAWDILPNDPLRYGVTALFVANGLLNMLWSLLYFRMERPDIAVIEVSMLQLTNLALIGLLAPYSTEAALCMVPYALWVAFAGYLNLNVVWLNGPFGATPQSVKLYNALGGRRG